MSKLVSFIIIALLPFCSFALTDSLQKAVQIASEGNNVQSERLKIAAENIANENTTGELPGSDPYKRKIMFVENKYDKNRKTNLLRVKKYAEDKAPFVMVYDPAHPAADENGYVKKPNIQMEIERSDANEAQRAYEANLGVVEMSRDMIQKTLDTIR